MNSPPRPGMKVPPRGNRARMAKIGYFLSSEQWTPQSLVDQARRAEDAGFEALWISDHFHPWNDAQGQGPFVWGVIGALSQVTSLPVSTAVTCPTMRIHPAIIAQAAATAAVQLDGRFVLGVGSGELLNEHIFGDPWPSVGVRLEMLEEAIDVIRLLHRVRRSATTASTTRCRRRGSTPARSSPFRSTCPDSARRQQNSPAGSATDSAPRCPTPNW